MKNKNAQSLMETMMVLVLVGMMASMAISAMKAKDLNGIRYRSAFKTLRKVAAEVAADSATRTLDASYCASMFAKMSNLSYTSCSTSTISSAPNFVLNNGMRFYGFEGALPATVTVDINGTAGPNTDDNDLLSFVISSDGTVIPENDTVEEGYARCKVILESYVAASEATVKTRVMTETGWADAYALNFIQTYKPATILGGANYTKAKTAETNIEAGGLASVAIQCF